MYDCSQKVSCLLAILLCILFSLAISTSGETRILLEQRGVVSLAPKEQTAKNGVGKQAQDRSPLTYFGDTRPSISNWDIS